MTTQSGFMMNSVVYTFVLLCCGAGCALAGEGPYAVFTWTRAHATFYGGDDARGTQGGACGYGNLYTRGYGVKTVALSYTVFNEGLTCGACFQIKCDLTLKPRWCYPNAGSVTVTATNSCPPNWARPTNNGGWCNPPRVHFDLSYPMFSKLAQKVAGIIPIQYRRVKCVRTGGIRFTINGNPYFNIVLVHNVGGYGNVVSLYIKGTNSPWFRMKQNWGANWEDHNKLTRQKLSFKASLGTGETMIFKDITGTYWSHGQTYEAYSNYY
ncbi:hypothetical protein Mapa_004738 [Marchantia paleacea]|nr:hypothetical protein Mapa_004738 [Marchantia paleacea]